MHVPRRNTLHTVGRQGRRSNTLQTALAGVTSSTAAPTATAAMPASPQDARMNDASSLDVGANLHAGHTIGIGHRLAFLDLVHDVHTGRDLANHRVLSIQESAVGIHD